MEGSIGAVKLLLMRPNTYTLEVVCVSVWKDKSGKERLASNGLRYVHAHAHVPDNANHTWEHEREHPPRSAAGSDRELRRRIAQHRDPREHRPLSARPTPTTTTLILKNPGRSLLRVIVYIRLRY